MSWAGRHDRPNIRLHKRILNLQPPHQRRMSHQSTLETRFFIAATRRGYSCTCLARTAPQDPWAWGERCQTPDYRGGAWRGSAFNGESVTLYLQYRGLGPYYKEESIVSSRTRLQFLTLVGTVLVAVTVAIGQRSQGDDPSLAGRQTSGLMVQPQPTPVIPEGNTGIAAKYPGDMGIEKDPNVIFVESFEGSVDEICSRWESVAGKPIMSKSDEVVTGSGGKQSLLLTRVAGGTDGYMDGGNLYRRLKNRIGGYGYDQLFLRFYMKFNEEHAPIHHYGSGLVGFNPTTSWPQGRAGQRPKADARWTTQVEPSNFDTWHFYSYRQGMGGSPPRGQTWGNTFEIGVPPRTVAKEKWICLEFMVKMNDIGDSNGEQAYWLDGRLSRNRGGKVTSYLGKGFPSAGTWTYDKFEPYVTRRGVAWDYRQGKGVSNEGGKPFPGFAWRNTPELNINAIWLYRYMSRPETGVSKVWWDHLVVAKKYIGPLTPLRR